MIIDCISDLHGFYPTLEGGDLLIVAGDLTARDTEKEFYEFANWMRNQSYEDMIVIPGNHDTWIIEKADSKDIDNWCDTGEFTFLIDSGVKLENGLKVWGSPWSLTFAGINPKSKAFTVDTEEELAEKWVLIPDDIDILITHSPPLYILDGIERDELDMPTKHVGSLSLSNRIWDINPRLCVFGHIHEGYGKHDDERMFYRQSKLIRFPIYVNASHVNERYQPVNKPIRIVL